MILLVRLIGSEYVKYVERETFSLRKGNMSGTKEGGLKSRDKNYQISPDFYRIIGGKGGRAKVPKGFSMMDRNKVAEAGRKGGTLSKRGYKLINEEYHPRNGWSGYSAHVPENPIKRVWWKIWY